MKTKNVRKLRLPQLTVELLEFPLGRHISGAFQSKISAPVGTTGEYEQLFRPQIDAFNASLGGSFARVPFAWPEAGGKPFGDFTGVRGSRIFRHVRAHLVGALWSRKRPRAAQDMIRLSSFRQSLTFHNGDRCACMHGARLLDGDIPELSIGVSPYQVVFETMNSPGIRFALESERERCTPGLKKLVARLVKRYGPVTMREALHREYRGNLPPFGCPFVDYLMGMLVLVTTSDGYVVLGRRTPGNVSVNIGINAPSSGGFEYDPDAIMDHGFSSFVEGQIRRELKEELNLHGNACTVTVTALIREVSRAGAPDFIGFVEFHGTLQELVNLARTNPFPNVDVDTLYGIPSPVAREIVVRPGITEVIHPKAVLALILWHRYLSVR